MTPRLIVAQNFVPVRPQPMPMFGKDKHMDAVSKDSLVRQLIALGVTPTGVLLVHTSFSKIRPAQGGPLGLITALRAAVGAAGTLVMPSMTSDDGHPFDPKSTPRPDMGIVADTFWRMPDVLRSESPHAFAAVGPRATSWRWCPYI